MLSWLWSILLKNWTNLGFTCFTKQCHLSITYHSSKQKVSPETKLRLIFFKKLNIYIEHINKKYDYHLLTHIYSNPLKKINHVQKLKKNNIKKIIITLYEYSV